MLRKYLIEITILLVGAFTMIFEIVGSRIIGPYMGTSVYVWTSLIGIIFASLSLGYWFGGLLSVKKSSYVLLSMMLIASAIFILFTAQTNIYILDRIVKYIPGFKIRILISAIVLFAPASLLFGMVLPYGVKLRVNNLSGSGFVVGRLYALSTLGSIIGTFLAGFFLLPELGHTNVQMMISLGLFLLAAAILLQDHKWVLSMIPSLLLMATALTWSYQKDKQQDFVDVDTPYNRVLIYNTTDKKTNRPIRMLRINNESSSAMFLDKDDDLVFEVLKYYRLVDHFVPGFQKTLMIGGSGYAYPKDFLKRHQHASIDVVEIDPGLTKLAGRYFDLPDDHRLSIIHEDGRTFINRTEKTYDAIFMDAYKSMLTVPFQLTTVEAVQHLRNILSDEGAVFANIISSLNEDNNQFLRAEVATYRKVFPHVYLFAVQYPNPTELEKEYFQNIMLVASKSAKPFNFKNTDPELDAYLQHKIKLQGVDDSQILTDEFAPVEYFASRVMN